jgi:epoxide hydrolase-like predicted phosphatase
MPNIEAVVWDLGGVLLRTSDREPRRAWERQLGLPQDSLDALVFNSPVSRRAALGEADVQDIWDNVARQLNLTPDQAEDLRRDFWRADQLDQSLVEKIRQLRSTYKTGLITNAWKDIRRSIEDVWHLDDVFDAILVSAEIGLAKPDPAIYRRLLDHWSLPAPAVVFIDDFAENIAAARDLGMVAIQFRDPVQAVAELDALLES